MISMERNAHRYDHSVAKLHKAGIFPTKFPASDGFCDAQQQLRKGCYAKSGDESKRKCVGDKWIHEKTVHDKSGFGCSSTEQAIADSHRRALLAAMQRKKKWTAILEEDVVPVRPERWNKAFKSAWRHIPEETKIVRLSYCMFPNGQYQTDQRVWKDTGEFMLAKWDWAPNRSYSPSGCTGGYLVHQDVIPEILALFPCCCAFDCCLEWDFFNKKVNDEHTVSRGMQLVMSMDAWGSTEYARDFMPYNMHQNGVLVQDCREVSSKAKKAAFKRGKEFLTSDGSSNRAKATYEASETSKKAPQLSKHRRDSEIMDGDLNAWGHGFRDGQLNDVTRKHNVRVEFNSL
jgi:hypothetical protein